MTGHNEPIRSCDRECMTVNHCQIGGIRCDKCGRYFCSIELDEDRLCEDCAEDETEVGE